MGALQLGAAVVAAVAMLASAPAARAQDGAYPSTGLPLGGAQAPAPSTCGRDSAPSDPSAYGRLDCRLLVDQGAPPADIPCSSPNRGFSGAAYSDREPLFGPGGEAYSYAGYGGSYSPYATGAGARVMPVGVSAEGGASAPSRPDCTRATRSPSLPAPQTAAPSRLDLGSLGLPTPAGIQRNTDLREPDVWLIPTRDGPVVERLLPDGRRTFALAPQSVGNSPVVWRPWGNLDRPAADLAWQSFASWWTSQGRAWPPN